MTTTQTEPYIALSEDEDEGVADCGCRLVADDGDTYSVGAAFYQCRQHAAAPALLAALEEIRPVIAAHEQSAHDNGEPWFGLARAIQTIDAAVAQARGE
jgi:hypothetical protein